MTKTTINGTFCSLCDGSSATFAYGIFTVDPRGKNATKKRKVDEISHEDSHRIIVYGDIHSKSSFVKYVLKVTEVDEGTAVMKCGEDVKTLYTSDMTTVFYCIDQVQEISTKAWNIKNITSYLKLNRKQKLLSSNLKKLSGRADVAKLFLKENSVWSKGCRSSLYRDILSAARVCSKSDLYWKVAVYFPPHIVRFCHLQDDKESLQKLHDNLVSWEMPSDICLYLNNSCWKYCFWEKQIQEIVTFWREQKFFVDAKHKDSWRYPPNADQLHDFEKRFKIVQYALEQKNLKKSTVFNFESKFENFEMEDSLLQHKVFYRMPWSDGQRELDEELGCPGLFGTGDLYCFWVDYLEAAELKGLIANRLSKQKIYFIEGYPTAEELKEDKGFVLNKGMQTYVEETLCPQKVVTVTRLTNLRDNHEHFKLNDEMTTIWFFGCEYYTIKDVIGILKIFKGFKCKLALHFFGHYQSVQFTAKKFNLLDWFSLSTLKDKSVHGIPKSSPVLPEEIDLKTADKETGKAANAVDVIRVAFSKKQKIIESNILYKINDEKKTGFYKSVSPQDFGTELIQRAMQVTPKKYVVTNKSLCVGVVNDILYMGNSINKIPRKLFNLNGKEIKVQVKSLLTQEIFPPKDLEPSPVISMSEITYPQRKVALVGEGWPSWAVNVFKNYLCTEKLYLTESFKMAEKDCWRLNIEESVYTNIINTEMKLPSST